MAPKIEIKAKQLKARYLLNKARQQQLLGSIGTAKKADDTGYESKQGSAGKVDLTDTASSVRPRKRVSTAKPKTKPTRQAEPNNQLQLQEPPTQCKSSAKSSVLDAAKSSSGRKKLIRQLSFIMDSSDEDEATASLTNDAATTSTQKEPLRLSDKMQKAAALALAQLNLSSETDSSFSSSDFEGCSLDGVAATSSIDGDESDNEWDSEPDDDDDELVNREDAMILTEKHPDDENGAGACNIMMEKAGKKTDAKTRRRSNVARRLVESMNKTGWSSDVEQELQRLLDVQQRKRKLGADKNAAGGKKMKTTRKAASLNVKMKGFAKVPAAAKPGGKVKGARKSANDKLPVTEAGTKVKEPAKLDVKLQKPEKTGAKAAKVAKIKEMGNDKPAKMKTEKIGSETVKKAAAKVKAPGKSKEPLVKKQRPAKGEMYVGAHVSISGGVAKAVVRANEMKARAFAMFTKNPRVWDMKPLADNDVEAFKDAMKLYGYDAMMVVPHGSYLLNCGSPKPELLQRSRNSLIEEMLRCEKLGLTMLTFHPGSTRGAISIGKCCRRISTSINMAHRKTTQVTAVVENMCCSGESIGGHFSELRDIIALVKDKSRVGVCLDTCHAFVAGYNLKIAEEYDRMMHDFESIIGLRYLKAVHINDSKGAVGSHLDRHENIGKGMMGMKCFNRIMNDPRFRNIPIILETPEVDHGKEIQKLYSLIGK